MTRDDDGEGMGREFWIAFTLGVLIGFFGGGFILLAWDRLIDDDRSRAAAEITVDLGDVIFYDIGQVHRMRLFDNPPEGKEGP